MTFKSQNIKDAIRNYYERIKPYHYYSNENYENISEDIKNQFDHGRTPVERLHKTDCSVFKKKYGYDLPDEIEDYINLFYHSHIFGYIDLAICSECIVLFPVLKYQGESENNIIFQKCGLMNICEDTIKCDIDVNMNRFITIGHTGYFEYCVLYEVGTQKIYLEECADIDGVLREEPIANSLTELIDMLLPYEIRKNE